MVIENEDRQTRERNSFRALLFQLASTHELEVVALRADATRLRSRIAQLERRFSLCTPALRPGDDKVGEFADVPAIADQLVIARGCLNGDSNHMEIDLDVHVPPEGLELEAFIAEVDAEAIDAFMSELYEEETGERKSQKHSTRSPSTKSSSRTVQIKSSWIQQPTLDSGVYGVEEAITGARFDDRNSKRGCLSTSTPRPSGRDDKGVNFADERPSLSHVGSWDNNFEPPPNLEPVEKRWRSVVENLCQFASKELYQLSPIWARSESVLAKARRTCNKIDLFGSEQQARRRTEESGFWAGVARISISPGSPKLSSPAVLLEEEDAQFLSHSRKFCGFRDFAEFERFIVVSPASTKRLAWAVLGLILMLYDLIMLPMEAFDLPNDIGLKVCAWTAQLYWTFDILLSFITGIYANGEVEMRLRKIARSYMVSWFAVDVLITLPLWFVLVLDLDGGAESARSLKSARYIRMLRFLRLARLAKFEHLLNEALEVVNSTSVILGFGIVKLMVIMVILNHVVACIWYWVGSGTQGRHDGWANEAKYADRSILYQYMSSLHWALTQFQGTSEITPGGTTSERVYAVTTVLFALIGLASFVSSLTNMMMQLESLQSKRTREQRVVRGYLSSHNVSYQLSMRVKQYLSWRQRAQKGREYDDEVKQMLPFQLMMDLHDEVRAPLLCTHVFFATFREVYPRTIRMMCSQAVSSLLPSPNELIFSTSDTATTMYFLMNGLLAYKPVISRLRKPQGLMTSSVRSSDSKVSQSLLFDEIKKGDFLSEQSLWTTWEHAGELTVTNKDAAMLTVDSYAFAECIKQIQLGVASAILYARRYLAGLNRFGKIYTDFITMEEHDSMMRAADDGLDTDSEEDSIHNAVVGSATSISMISTMFGAKKPDEDDRSPTQRSSTMAWLLHKSGTAKSLHDK